MRKRARSGLWEEGLRHDLVYPTRLNEADYLPMCLVFEPITASRIRDLALPTPEKPIGSAIPYVMPEEVDVLAAVAWQHNFNIPRSPPNAMTISEFIVLAAEKAGLHPSKRQPFPGTQKLWEGLKILSIAIFEHFAILKSKIEIG